MHMSKCYADDIQLPFGPTSPCNPGDPGNPGKPVGPKKKWYG